MKEHSKMIIRKVMEHYFFRMVKDIEGNFKRISLTEMEYFIRKMENKSKGDGPIINYYNDQFYI